MTDPGIVQTAPRTIILMPYGADVRTWTFPIKPVPPTKTGRTKIVPKRATVGPPDPDRDDTLSTLNLSDLSGGQGIYRIQPATDIGHSWWHTASVSGTDGWTGARETIAKKPVSSTGDCVPVGRIGTRAYALWGTALHGWDPDAEAWGAAQATIGTVVNTEGIALFNDRMYFPLGEAGYTSIAETAVPGVLGAVATVAGAATPTAESAVTNPKVWAFFVHNEMLWAITTEAEGFALCNTLTGGTNAWYWPWNVARASVVTLNTSFKPKAMASFPNAQQRPALWVSGRGGLRVYDADETTWATTPITDVPPHPDFGRALTVFRTGEALWISAGGGDIFKFTSNGNPVPASGPGGANEGMPADKRGSAISAANDLAFMYWLFHGDQTVGASPSIVEDASSGDPLYVPGAVAYSTVIAQSGKGWHPVWESASEGVPTKIVVADSERDDGSIDYRAFWGQGEFCWSMTCRLYTTSSRQAIMSGMGERYMVTTVEQPNAAGYIEWGEFSGTSYAVRDLVSHVGIDMDLASSVDYVEYQWYSSDTAQSWETLGIATSDSFDGDGRTILPFGLSDDGLFSRGHACWWIRQRLRWVTTNATTPAIVRAVSLAFMPQPQDAATKTYQVLLPAGGTVDPETKQTAEMIVRQLESLLDEYEEFLFLQDGQHKYRAYVASISYALASTPDASGVLNLTVIQIPTGAAGLVGEG